MRYAFGLLLAAIAAAALGQPRAPSPDARSAAQGYFQHIERIAPGIWVIRENEPFHLQPIGNVVVIEQADGLVLFDGGGSPGSGRRIVALIESVSRKPVKAIAISHWHGDHSLGVSALRARWPAARVITTVETREHLLGRSMQRYAKDHADPAATRAFLAAIGPPIEALRPRATDPSLPAQVREGYARTLGELRQYSEDVDGLFLVTPSETFRDRLLLPDPVRPVELRYLGRGNTDGDAIAWLPRQRIVASGDLVVAPIPFGFDSYPADWMADLAQLAALRYRVLIPGHGAPQHDTVYIDHLREMIGDMRAQIAPLAAQGLDLAAVIAHLDMRRHQAFFAGSDPWLQLWFRDSWVRPFSDDVLKEARGIAIEQGEG